MKETIKQSVGQGGKNQPEDVETIRKLLNRHQKWAGPVAASGEADSKLNRAITKFQETACAIAKPHGRVDPGGFTISRLNLAQIPGPKHRLFRSMCWNVNSTISAAAYKQAASTLGCEVAAIRAVADVESKRDPFDRYGRPTILFERHKFRKFTASKFNKSHPDLSNAAGGYGKFSEQYGKLARAAMLNEEAALKSASWGAFQIMGFNHKAAGHATVVGFVDAMAGSAERHLQAFVAFVSFHASLKKAIKDKDWAAFAKGYNGDGYAKNQYDTKMAAAYKKFKAAETKSSTTRTKPSMAR